MDLQAIHVARYTIHVAKTTAFLVMLAIQESQVIQVFKSIQE